jgi:hypothetical protein
MNEAGKELKDMNEIELYFVIEGAGGFIHHMNHELSHGRIPSDSIPGVTKDIDHVRQQQLSAIKELSRVGLLDMLDASGIATPAYWQWYCKWNNWHKMMSEASWRLVDAALTVGLTEKQIAQYRQESDMIAAEMEATAAAAAAAEAENNTKNQGCCCCKGSCKG